MYLQKRSTLVYALFELLLIFVKICAISELIKTFLKSQIMKLPKLEKGIFGIAGIISNIVLVLRPTSNFGSQLLFQLADFKLVINNFKFKV